MQMQSTSRSELATSELAASVATRDDLDISLLCGTPRRLWQKQHNVGACKHTIGLLMKLFQAGFCSDVITIWLM